MPIILNAIGAAVLAVMLGVLGFVFARKKRLSKALLVIAGLLLLVSAMHFIYFLLSFG